MVPSFFYCLPTHPPDEGYLSIPKATDRRPPDVGARKQEISLKVDIPPFHRVCQYSGGKKSLLNTKEQP
jgi:hypothetical protein